MKVTEMSFYFMRTQLLETISFVETTVLKKLPELNSLELME